MDKGRTMTATTKKQGDAFLMVKLDPELKKDLQRVLVDEDGMDMSKATRAALVDWIAKTRKRQERAAAKNGAHA